MTTTLDSSIDRPPSGSTSAAAWAVVPVPQSERERSRWVGVTMAIARAAGFRRLRAGRTPWYWWVLRFVLLTIVLITGLVIGAWFYITDPGRLEEIITGAMGEALAGEVTMRDATFSLDEGLVVNDLRIHSVRREGEPDPHEIARIRRIQIVPDFEAMALDLLRFRFRPSFKSITIDRPTLVLHFDETGRFVDEDVFIVKDDQGPPSEGPGIALPPIEVRQATFRWRHPVIFADEEQQLDNLTLQLRPGVRRGWLELDGFAVGEPLGRFEYGGRINVYDFETRLEIVNHNLELNERTMRHFSAEINGAYKEFAEVPPEITAGARAELEARVELVPGRAAGFSIDVHVLDGAIAYHQFPVPVHSVIGHINLTNYEPGAQMAAFPTDADLISATHDILANRPAPSSQVGLWVSLLLRGRYGHSGEVSLAARIDTGSGAEDIRVACRDVLVDEEFRRAIRLSQTIAPEVQDLMDMFIPSGVADANFHSISKAGQASSDQKLRLWLHDVNALFKLFPVPVFRLRGEVEGWEGTWNVPWAEMLTREDGGAISMYFREPTKLLNDDLQLSIEVTAPDVELTPTMVAAMPEYVGELIREYGLSGTVDLQTAVVETRAGDTPDDSGLLLELDIIPRNMAVEWSHLPWRLNCDGGRLQVRDTRVIFDGVTGTHGDDRSARITLSGTVETPPNDAPPIVALDFTGENVAIDGDLWDAIAAEPRPGTTSEGPPKEPLLLVNDLFRPQGRFDFEYRLRTHEEPSQHIDMWVHGDGDQPATIEYDLAMGALGVNPDQRLVISNATGHIRFQLLGETVHVGFRGLRGTFNGADLRVDGILQVGRDQVPHTTITITARNVPLDAGTRAAFDYFEDLMWRYARDDAGEYLLRDGKPYVALDDNGEEPKRVWDMLKPDGLVDLRLDLLPTGDPEATMMPVIHGTLRGASIELVDTFPYELQDMHGKVSMEGGVIRATDIRARHNQATVLIPEAVFTTPVRGFQARVLARDMSFNKELRDALPSESWKQLYDVLDPYGRFDVAASVDARLHATDAEKMVVTYDMELQSNADDLNVGPIRAEQVTGHLRMRGRVEADGTIQSHGRMRIDEARWRGMKIHGLTGDMQITQDGENVSLTVPRAFGSLYGGFIETRFEMNAVAGGDYHGYARIVGLDIGRWLREVYPGSYQLKGTADAELLINGRLAPEPGEDAPATAEAPKGEFHGLGRFDVYDAIIFDVPLVLKLFDFSNYSQPTPVDEVRGRFHMLETNMYFEQLDMVSDAVGFYGQGAIDYNMNMDTAFAIDFAPRFRGLPQPIRGLFQFVEQTLLPVYVQGPISNPTISAVFREAGADTYRRPDNLPQWPRGTTQYARFRRLLAEVVAPDHRAMSAASVKEAIERLSSTTRQRLRLLVEQRRDHAISGDRKLLDDFERLLRK